MNYDERKAQLDAAMKKAVAKTNYGFCFVATDKPKIFYPLYFGEKREEELLEVYASEEYGDIYIVTKWNSGNGAERIDSNIMEERETSRFIEFSNEEMEQIMSLCGVEIPDENESTEKTYDVTLKVEAYVTYTVNAKNETEAKEAALENFTEDQCEREFVSYNIVPADGDSALIKIYEPELIG